MALVAYDCSDESDHEEDEVQPRTGKIILSPVRNGKPALITPLVDSEDEEADIRTSHNDSESEEDDEEPITISFSRLRKPTHEKIYVDESKVTNIKSDILKKLLPPRSQTSGTGSMKLNKNAFKSSEKGSGLLSVLPTPTKDFINPLFKPTNESSSSSSVSSSSFKLIPRSLKNKTAQEAPKSAKKNLNNESDEDDNIGGDFFSLTKEDSSEDLDMESLKMDFETNADDLKPERSESQQQLLDNYLSSNTGTEPDDVNDTYAQQELSNRLSEEAMQKLCGPKRKGQIPDNIQIIDVHEDDVLAETRKNLTKQLTQQDSYRPTSKKASGTSTLGKRKHQITYLAFQAKEREMELKNQWSNSRLTKKQTQSKYGFI